MLGLLLGGDLTTTSRGQVEDVFTDEVQTSIEDSRGGRVGQRLRIYLGQTQIHRPLDASPNVDFEVSEETLLRETFPLPKPFGYMPAHADTSPHLESSVTSMIDCEMTPHLCSTPPTPNTFSASGRTDRSY